MVEYKEAVCNPLKKEMVSVKNNILIVDDEKSNIIALMNMLNAEYKVRAVRSGREAIDASEKEPPDLILLDILMPEMDGYEVIKELKKSEKTRDIPVIFITGLDSPEAEEKGLHLGASDYITKPFRTGIVKLRVQNHIQLTNQFDMIRTLSFTDELTGLFNRRGFDSRLSLEWNRARRAQTPLSIVMFDIDNFKDYNDEYGHLQGDAALQSVAEMSKASLKRAIDLPARWGGEEFTALLPDTCSYGASVVAENIRKNIEKNGIPCVIGSGNLTEVTVSVGVNTCIPNHDTCIQDFVADVDKALYQAKKAGKNIVFASGSNEKGAGK
jgi:diguanylate cyclase (GGDEF)-like protein